MGVRMTPGAATAFTRMPRVAYSIAMILVAEFIPPFVSMAMKAGELELANSAVEAVICTTWTLL